jgi:hypothetical protein
MDPADVALLFILGSAEPAPARFEDICAAARYVAPQDWQPTSEVMRASTERAIRDGLLFLCSGEGDAADALETTRLGRTMILTLLRKPIPGGGGSFPRTCMTVKLCFLHLLPPPARHAEAATLEALYRSAVDIVRRLQGLPPALGGAARADLRAERVRLESELAWLEALSRCQPMRQAAE